LFAAFEGYGFYTRHRGAHYSRGGPFLGAARWAGPAGPGSAQAAPGAATSAGGAATTAPAAQSPKRGGAANVTSASPTVGEEGGAASARGQARLAVPRPGRYALAVRGSESVSFGPVAFCHNGFPATAELGIGPAAGEQPHSYDFDLRLYPSSPNAHDERHIYRYSATGVDLVFEEATVTCAGIEQSTTVNYTPPQVRVRSPLEVGERWTSHGGDSNRTENTVSTVTRTDRVSVGPSSYEVFVIETHVDMTGSEHGTRVQTWWWSPQLAMALRFAEQIQASRSGASYSESYTATVASFPS